MVKDKVLKMEENKISDVEGCAEEKEGRGKLSSFMQKSSPVLILLFLFIFMSVASPMFLKTSNLLNIIRQSSVLGIMALGETLVILTAGIDLSVGSVMAACGCLIAVTSTKLGFPPWLSVTASLGMGTLIGIVNGLVITRFKIQDFIATLGTMTAVSGLALFISGGIPISGLPDILLVLGSGTVGVVPVSVFVFAGVAALIWIMLNHTTLGVNIYAVGGNPEAARVSGIKVEKIKVIVYGLCGFCCALGSLVMVGRLGGANAIMGSGMELLAITAVALGGTSLVGGIGSIGGTVIGIITIGVLNNGLDLTNVTPFWQKVILGIVIVVVVSFDTWREKKMKK